MAIASLKRLQTQLADRQQRAAVHRVQIRQLSERTRANAIADNRGSEKSNQADPSQIQHRDAANGS
jgi:hypothetical protein